MFKKLAASAALIPFIAAPAFAADHEGFRIGLDAIHSESDVTLGGVGNPDSELSETGLAFHAGYDAQLGDFVVGALVSYAPGGPDETASAGLGVRQTTSIESLATAEARVGYAFGGVMPYAIGGVVKRDLDVTRCTLGAPAPGPVPLGPSCIPASVSTLNYDETAALWGAGVELNAADGITFNLSYVEADFETESGQFGVALPFTVDHDLRTVRLSASYRF